MKLKKYIFSIIVFEVLLIQIFYELPDMISFVKLFVIFSSFLFIWVIPVLENPQQIRFKNIQPLVILYFITIIISSAINVGINNYTIIDALIGLFVLVIPLGFYKYFIQNPNVIASLKQSFRLQRDIAIGAFIILIYVSVTGNFTDFGSLGSRFTGGSISPSIISLNANLLLSFCLLNITKYKKKILLIPIIVSIALILLSLSKNGILITILCFFYVAIINKKYVSTIIVLSIVVVLSFFFLPWVSIVDILYGYFNSEDALTTLSGRNAIWDVCDTLINKNPIWGYGYNSTVKILAPKVFTLENVNQAHNVYYESMLNLGAVGTIILLVYVLKVIFQCIAKFSVIVNNTILSWFFFVIINFIIRGYTEASFAQANNIIEIFIFFISIFSLDYYLNRLKNRTLMNLK